MENQHTNTEYKQLNVKVSRETYDALVMMAAGRTLSTGSRVTVSDLLREMIEAILKEDREHVSKPNS